MISRFIAFLESEVSGQVSILAAGLAPEAALFLALVYGVMISLLSP